jgi:hypothetical protein
VASTEGIVLGRLESEPMLRLRLATNLLFDLLLAVWVFYDARTRRARKPLFASLLTVLWGPLGVAFWVSDRPLAATEERRGGTGWVMARTFVMAASALVPAAFLLVAGGIRDRSAVPGSMGAAIGVAPASLVVTAGGWALLASLALTLGALTRNTNFVERGTSAVRPASPRLGVALVIAAAAAFVFALVASGF